MYTIFKALDYLPVSEYIATKGVRSALLFLFLLSFLTPFSTTLGLFESHWAQLIPRTQYASQSALIVIVYIRFQLQQLPADWVN